jgi:hypothetical protein
VRHGAENDGAAGSLFDNASAPFLQELADELGRSIAQAQPAGRPQDGVPAEYSSYRDLPARTTGPPRHASKKAAGTSEAIMGVRTRGLDMKAGFKRGAADKAARAEAEAVIQSWNDQLAHGRDMLWSPTIRAALLAGTPWLDVFCPGCGTNKAIDLRTVDRHPLASVGSLVLGLRCSWCPGSAPMPKLIGLFALPPSRRFAADSA